MNFDLKLIQLIRNIGVQELFFGHFYLPLQSILLAIMNVEMSINGRLNVIFRQILLDMVELFFCKVLIRTFIKSIIKLTTMLCPITVFKQMYKSCTDKRYTYVFWLPC